MLLFKEGGAYCFAHVNWLVGMSFSFNLVQLITQERFAQDASIFIGRYSVTCLNRIALGPKFPASLERNPDKKG